MNGQIQYGLFRPMTSALTGVPANLDLPWRLAAFRHDMHLAGDHPTRAELDTLIARARELELGDEHIGHELEEIHACGSALDLADAIARGELPIAESNDRLPAGDVCHFASPVRFGRRRTDQFGHLELTDGWLKFHSVIDVSVAWSEVGHVHRLGREVTITLVESTRLLRFWCPCLTDAARAAVLAQHFARLSRGHATPPDAPCHAWV